MRNPLTTQTVSDELQRLLTAFPRRGDQNLARLADVYKTGLVGVETDALRGAVSRCIQEDEFFPKVARLRGLSDEWMKRNRAQFAPVVQASWGTCGICGAEATTRPITRPRMEKGDPSNANTWTPILGPNGQPELETVESRSLYMDHDPRRHNVMPGEQE